MEDTGFYVGFIDPKLISRHEHKLASWHYIDGEVHLAKWNRRLAREMLWGAALFGVLWGLSSWFVYVVLLDPPKTLLGWGIIGLSFVWSWNRLLSNTARDMAAIRRYRNQFLRHTRRRNKAAARYMTEWKKRMDIPPIDQENSK